MHFNKFNLEGLDFPMKFKDVPKFENLKTQSAFGIGLRLNVNELNGTVLTTVHINKIYLQ